ncbi:MAG: hypothetical protein LC808_31620 [Actinobacteria bacterium]|nr:hypothetical protein [Actinomycetota bacterium]
MALDTSTLRTPDVDFPIIKDRIVTLIRITHEGVTQATTTTDKREMLRSVGQEDTLIAVWTGKRYSDAFRVTAELLARWKQDLLG